MTTPTPKAITCPVILGRCSTRADGSLSLTFSTPELTPDEKVALMELQNQNLKMLLQPSDSEPAEFKEVRGHFDTKTPSQRLRSVLFVFWKQADGTGDFEDFYRTRMSDIIDMIKKKLEPMPKP